MDASTSAGVSVEEGVRTQEFRDAPLSALPFVGNTVSFVERYGWFLLVGVIVLYWATHKIYQRRAHHQVYDPSRVSRLNDEVRTKRAAQQAHWAGVVAETTAEERAKEKQQEEERRRARRAARTNEKDARQALAAHLDEAIDASDDDDDDDNDDDPVRALHRKKKGRSSWVDKMSGAAASKSGFKPYNKGTGSQSNIHGVKRFGGGRNCGPSS